MKMNRLTIQRQQAQGFTLIELLVSMTLGLVLLGGMMSMYFGSRTADKTRTELGDIEANARVALAALREGIKHAGYASLSYTPLEKPFHTTADGVIDNPTCRDGGKLVVSGSTAADGTGVAGLTRAPSELTGYTKDYAAGDIITVIARPDDPTTGPIYFDCGTISNSNNTFAAGSINHAYQTSTSTQAEDIARQTACSTNIASGMHDPLEAKMYSAFFLKNNVAGELKQLMCYGSRSSSSTPLVIADNIDNMQIRYGVLTGAIGGKGGNVTFKTADQVEDLTTGGWESVISVQVAILVGSDNQKVLVDARSRTFDLLDITIPKPDTDYRMYKVYTTTINLPNRSQRDF
jgi:type IV pilus assembly protein PilW